MPFSVYNLTHNPFDKTIAAKDAFLSGDHKEMVSRLNFLKDIRGIGVFTAVSGSGKTFAVRCFVESLNPNLYESHYLCLSTVSIMDFYRQICTSIGVEPSGRKADMFRAIKENLYYVKKEKRHTIIIILDECQFLSYAVLCDLSMLMNFNYDSFSAFALVLVGLPHFNNNLLKPLNEPLRERIIVNYNFSGLSNDEVQAYIFSRIESAGGAFSIIDEAAVNAIAGASQGKPRIINTLMTGALMLATQMGKPSIDTDTILAASNAMALG
jgi:type II secretory pathway predicted ATPase ExeA